MLGSFLTTSIKPETDFEHLGDRDCFAERNLYRSDSENIESIRVNNAS